jgi:hypothetical protein
MEFLKAEDLTLNPAGYLVSKGNKPVNNEAFISAQTSAHLFCSIAAACEGKTLWLIKFITSISSIRLK